MISQTGQKSPKRVSNGAPTCVGRHSTEDAEANDGDESPTARREELHGERFGKGGGSKSGKTLMPCVSEGSRSGKLLQQPAYIYLDCILT